MILHLLTRSQWAVARQRGVYRPPSLETEGFIHCSTINQGVDTANILYRGQLDLLVLRIDERKLTSTLKFETPANLGDARSKALFPHIYGPLNLDAVIDAIDLPCSADGSFRLPAALAIEARRLGRTEFAVSVLGFGASEIGYQNVASGTVKKLLNDALDAGLNIIDTAACYATSEELIGAAIGHRRSDYFIFTKCGHASGLPVADWMPDLVEQSLARSLKRLHTDYVDLLQFHSCTADEMRGDDLVAALIRVKEKGLTRAIGYSGDGVDALYAVETGVFDTLQISVNVADQQAVDLAIPAAAARDMGVIAKRPLANAAWRFSRWRIGDYEKPYWLRLKDLRYDFIRKDPKGAAETALRFTLTVPGVATAIVGTARPSRWAQNAAIVAAGALPGREFDAIRARWHSVAKADWIGQR
jgi:aryl-alcohol dehydrogenase-like predicted oxidoreductase/uncharacterized protein (DUF952 family)